MARFPGVVAYLTMVGTVPWIIGGLAVGLGALISRTRPLEPGSRGLLLLLAVIAFVFAALAIVVLAVSRACEAAGGCMH